MSSIKQVEGMKSRDTRITRAAIDLAGGCHSVLCREGQCLGSRHSIYLRHSTKPRIPASWEVAMEAFDMELEEQLPLA